MMPGGLGPGRPGRRGNIGLGRRGTPDVDWGTHFGSQVRGTRSAQPASDLGRRTGNPQDRDRPRDPVEPVSIASCNGIKQRNTRWARGKRNYS